jgi:hypothetical protein
MDKNNEPQPRIGLLGGFSSYAHLLRFCIAATFVLGLVFLSVWLLLHCLKPGQGVSVSFNEEKTVVISINNQPSKALVLLSASHLWTNTGLKMRPNQKINIGATGRVNLAVHRLVDAAKEDVKPRHGWVDPDGDQFKNEKPLDLIRKPLLIEPQVVHGCLLAYVRPQGEPDPGKENPKPTGIQVVGRNNEIIYRDPSGREGTLFLTVNEGVPKDDAKSKAAYIANQEVLDETYGKNKVTVAMLRARWDYIVRENYWEVWYDDNVGEFLVQINYDNTDKQ